MQLHKQQKAEKILR